MPIKSDGCHENQLTKSFETSPSLKYLYDYLKTLMNPITVT